MLKTVPVTFPAWLPEAAASALPSRASAVRALCFWAQWTACGETDGNGDIYIYTDHENITGWWFFYMVKCGLIVG